MKTLFSIVVIVTMFSMESLSQNLSYQVAYDKLGVIGQYPHLWEYSRNYHYYEEQVSFDILEEKNPYRDVVIAREYLTMRYTDVEKKSEYAAEITFFTSDTALVQQILVDGKIVKEEILIPVNEVFRQTINIPGEARQDGTFDITIRKTQGDWVTASEVAIFSNVKKALQADDYLATIKIPRISPIPGKVRCIIQKDVWEVQYGQELTIPFTGTM